MTAREWIRKRIEGCGMPAEHAVKVLEEIVGNGGADWDFPIHQHLAEEIRWLEETFYECAHLLIAYCRRECLPSRITDRFRS